jgi:hypothetical protein
MNSLTHKPASAISLPTDDDPYGEIAMEGGGQFGKILKYVKGRWSHADKEIALGTEFTALIPEAMRGDVRFQDGKPIEQRLGLVRNRAKHAVREDLGFNDKSKWQVDRKGNPVDPWSPQTYLPMIHSESGDFYCYIFGRSHGAKQAFRDLCREYSPYRTTTMLPVVSLQTDHYDHDEYGWTDVPVLKIERWEDSGNMPPEPTPSSDGGANAKVIGEHKAGTPPPARAKPPAHEDPISTGRPRRNSDMDDDIPFSPEWR